MTLSENNHLIPSFTFNAFHPLFKITYSFDCHPGFILSVLPEKEEVDD